MYYLVIGKEEKEFMHLQNFVKIVIRPNLKGGPGAAVEPTVCNRKVPGSSPSLLHICVGKAGGLKTTLPQTPHSAGSLRHWVRPFFLKLIFVM